MNSLRIIFMGTPEFAVPSLEILLQNNYNVVAVITAQDKPKGRGQQVNFSPVKACALRYHIPVLQPPNLKSVEFLETLNSFEANLQIVVAFRMLPEVVWSKPALGTFNLHGSLLPQYRGAAPINWAIINGEVETGVSTFFLQHEIDTGSIIYQEKESIGEDDTVGDVYTRLMAKGADLVLKTVQSIARGDCPSTPQAHATELKHAPKIFKETCEINWNQPGRKVKDFIRGLSPYPAAWTYLHGKVFKIYKVSVVDNVENADQKELITGQFLTDNKDYLYFKAIDGYVAVEELQPEGKKRMNIKDFFRGNKI